MSELRIGEREVWVIGLQVVVDPVPIDDRPVLERLCAEHGLELVTMLSFPRSGEVFRVRLIR